MSLPAEVTNAIVALISALVGWLFGRKQSISK